jgi:hypothetical protein
MSATASWKVAKWLSIALFCIGSTSWVFGFLYSQSILSDLRNVEFPLGDLENIAVDSNGNMYCSLGFYSRIQVYNPQGEFQRAWFVPAHGGPFWIDVDSHDQVHVWSVRGQEWIAYDDMGNRIDADPAGLDRSSPLRAASVGLDLDRYTRSPYAIRNRWIFPRVVKIDATGVEHTVLTGPVHLWFFMGPVPAMLEVALGLVGIGVCKFVLGQVYRNGRAAQPKEGDKQPHEVDKH